MATTTAEDATDIPAAAQGPPVSKGEGADNSAESTTAIGRGKEVAHRGCEGAACGSRGVLLTLGRRRLASC